MFEDLRKSASESYEEIKDAPVEEFDSYDYEEESKPAADRPGFLGMTAAQRFILALLLLVMSCVLAGFCLVLTGKVSLPFF